MRQAMKEISKGLAGVFIVIGFVIAVICIGLGVFYLCSLLGISNGLGATDSDPWVFKTIVGILMLVMGFLIVMGAFGAVMIAYYIGEGTLDFIKNLGQSGIDTYTNLPWKNKWDGLLTRTIQWLKEKIKNFSIG